MDKFKILEVLTKEPEISQKALALQCELSIGKVNYLLNQLAEQGFLAIEKLGKRFRYNVTEKGRDYMRSEIGQFQDTKVNLHDKEKKVVKQAVILAAGNREQFEKPACLLDINGTTLLERNIGILESNGIEKIIIVVGYQKDLVINFEGLKGKDNIIFTENDRYLWTGSMASLAAAAPHITDDFILIEDDILIEEKAIIELLNHPNRDCMLVTKESGSGDEAFIEIRNGYLYKISKDVHQLNRIDGEMIGITKISDSVYKEMIEQFKDNKNPYMHYEYMLLDVTRTVNMGYLKIADMIWAEIDNQQHYFKVTDKYYRMLQRKEAEFRERELKQLIADTLNISIDEITSIETLGGLINRNYKVEVGEETYAVRIPGKGTEDYINRASEKHDSEMTSRIGVNPKIIYFNGETGLKIVEYIPNAETLNSKTGKREDNLKMVAGLFRTLHQSGEKMKDRFDVFEKIVEYETVLTKLNGRLLDGHDEVKKQVLELEDYYKSLNVQLTPCHNDPLAENFVKSGENRMYLIDWEFAGMNDPLWDIADYIIEAELSSADEKLFLLEYFNGNITDENLQRLLMNKIFIDFLWTLWALMKEAGGEDFGSYAYTRFARAKGFLKEYHKLYKGNEIIGKI
jgi:thiamine kinase-like enzyme/choline kinase/predicted transcriptional regulator